MIFLLVASFFALSASKIGGEKSQPNTDYPFINYSMNNIVNYSSLNPFWMQLDLLESRMARKAHIVHIGDSHLQADFFSGEVRQLLQERFGSAGRGLVFPYRLAGTHGPKDVSITSNTSWQSQKIIAQTHAIPVGLAGFSIESTNSNFSLDLYTAPSGVSDNRFDRVTFFNMKGNEYYDYSLLTTGGGDYTQIAPYSSPVQQPVTRTVQEQKLVRMEKKSESRVEIVVYKVKSGESLYLIAQNMGTTIDDIKKRNNLKSNLIHPNQELKIQKKVTKIVEKPIYETITKYVTDNTTPSTHSTVYSPPSIGAANGSISSTQTVINSGYGYYSIAQLPSETNNLKIQGVRGTNLQYKTHFDGILLENTGRTGVMYSMIGADAAQFMHYNRAEHFFQQLAGMEADLIIISLGTNESAGWGNVSEESFRAEVESFISSVRRNAPTASILLSTNPDCAVARSPYNNVSAIRNVLIEVAARNNLAYWDLQTIMGGRGSIHQWRANGLSAADNVHFTQQGYILQGELLYNALMNGYGYYKSTKH